MANFPNPALKTAMKDSPLEVLSQFQFFGGFKPKELEVLVSLAEEFTFPPEAKIIREGDVEDCMFVLLEGRVGVTKKVGEQVIDLTTLEPGSFFGEIALVDDGPRSASVTALEASKALRISRSTISVLAGVQPSTALHLLEAIGRSLVRLLRRSNQKYLDLFLSEHVPSPNPGSVEE